MNKINFQSGGIFSNIASSMDGGEYLIPVHLNTSDSNIKIKPFKPIINLGDIEDDFIQSFDLEQLLSSKSLVECAMNDFSKQFNDHLSSYVKKNLSDRGYEFSSESEFLEFSKNRITRVGFASRPNYYELYLDRTILVGCYSDKTEITHGKNGVNGEITVTIG